MNIYGVGCYSCYRLRWRRPTNALDNNFSFLEKNYVHSLYTKIVSIVLVFNFIILLHNFIILGITISYVFIASCSKYSFTQTIFSTQQTVTTSYFRRTNLGRVGKMSSWFKINKREGVEQRMSWYAFLKK